MPFNDMQMPFYALIEIFERTEGAENDLYNFLEQVDNLISVSTLIYVAI